MRANELSLQTTWLVIWEVIVVQFLSRNRPHSIYQYSNMAPRLSGQNSIFSVVCYIQVSFGN